MTGAPRQRRDVIKWLAMWLAMPAVITVLGTIKLLMLKTGHAFVPALQAAATMGVLFAAVLAVPMYRTWRREHSGSFADADRQPPGRTT